MPKRNRVIAYDCRQTHPYDFQIMSRTMEDMTPELWKERVGDRVAARREELGLSRRRAASEAGTNETSWRQAEAGRRTAAQGVVVPSYPTRAMKVTMARMLQWPDDALDRLAAGEDPATFELERKAAEPSPIPGAFAANSIDLSDLTPSELAAVRGFIAGIRAR